MVRGFTEKEKQRIRLRLLEEGRQMFGQYGLKKTSIAELTKAVGIAQGSFYLFYGSKEELFFDILQLEEASLQEELVPLLQGTVTTERFRHFLLNGLKSIAENPFVRMIYAEGVYEQLVRKLPDDKLEEHTDRDADTFRPLIDALQEQGGMIREDPDVITGMIRSFFTMTLHKKEIGADVYEEALQLMAKAVSSYLIVEGGNPEDGQA